MENSGLRHHFSHKLGWPTRREVLGAGTMLASAVLTGCAIKTIPFPFQCHVPLTAASEANQPLLIDAHCHIFNGTDIQIDGFITKIEARNSSVEGIAKIFADLFQGVVWADAPNGREELAMLKKLAACTGSQQIFTKVDEHRQDSYAKAKRAITGSKTLVYLALAWARDHNRRVQ